MVNSLSPMTGSASRGVSPARSIRPAAAVVSNVNVPATAHPVRVLIESLNSDDEFVFRLHSLYDLQTQLTGAPEAKDVFRLSLGFESVFEALKGITQRETNDLAECIELFKCIFNVFSDAMSDSSLNRRYFAEKLGFDSVRNLIESSRLVKDAPKQVMGILMAFLVSDFALHSLFVTISRGIETLPETASFSDVTQYINDRTKKLLSGAVISNSIVIPFFLDLIVGLHNDDVYTAVSGLISLSQLATISSHNKVALCDRGLMDLILFRSWDGGDIDERILLEYRRLTESLIELGVSTEQSKLFFKHAMTSDDVSDLLLSGIKRSREPAHIVFDLSLCGHSAIEINSLARTFPPTSTGYTFTSWIKIDKYDDNYHTTLFGVFDNSQKCFTLVYIEKETKKLILQTSITSTRGSVRFKSVSFEPGVWYFICISHRRARVSSTPKASLHVNGEFVETIKCPYPSNPPNDGPAQAFIGTPADLTSGPERSRVQSLWRLSSLHIFEDILSDDVLAVHYRLGPRYYGNYQDTLASFQTYEASAALTLRNENLHVGREDTSDIITVIRGRASNLLPESKIILSIHAKNVIDPRSLQNDYGFRPAPKTINALSRNHLIIVNAAVPDINIAFTAPNGVGIGSGDPVPVIPQSLDDSAWRLGGSALALKMTELAKTPDQLCRAVSIAFELLRENWRNSDDMERVHGFAILGNLIKAKTAPGIINKRLLDIILEFVGYNFAEPLDSIIINPLAYRTLLVDFDIWKVADISTLRFYFDQFSVFGLQSKHHVYNSKRLTRMRIVKKFLQSLKTESFTRESLEYFIPAFKRIIMTNISAEVMRSLSLFITYAFNQNQPVGTKRYYSDDKLGSSGILLCETGFMVLKVFTEILCDPSSNASMKKFARTVTNKWVLYLLAQDDNRAVISGAKILARLLIVHGASYVSKFSSKNGGFVIMKERLKTRWNITELWPICLAVLFGVDIATLEIKNSLDLFYLLEMFRRGGKAVVAYPEMFAVIGAMLKGGALSIISEEHKKEGKSFEQQSVSDADSEQKTKTSFESRDFAKDLQVITQFFSEMHATCPAFQDFCTSSIFIQEVLGILFPAICNSESFSPEIELQSRDSALTFDGGDVVVRPASGSGTAQIMKTVRAPSPTTHAMPSTYGERPRASSLRRGSSFVLVSADLGASTASGKASLPSLARRAKIREFKVVNTVVEGLLEMVVAVFVDQVLTRKDFSELNISILIPPTFQEYQIYFETYLFRNTVSQLNTTIFLNMRILCESRTLINFGKFAQQLVDSVFNGWFLGGAEPLIDLIGRVIEYLQQPAVERLKTVRLCHNVVSNLRLTFMKLILFRLSELDDMQTEPELMVQFLEKMLYWQNVLLSPAFAEDNLIKLICYLLYIQLIDADVRVRNSAVDNWRMVLVHKPVETSLILDQVKTVENRELSKGFKKLMELDNTSFLTWIDSNRAALDDFFLGTVSKDWEAFVANENRTSDEITRVRSMKRRERLRQTAVEDSHNRSIFNEHKMALRYWRSAIYHTEHVKFMRNIQDQQDTLTFLSSEYAKLEIDLTRPRGVIYDGKKQRWRLDLTEGRDRMRKRMMPDTRANMMKYLAKGEEESSKSSQSELTIPPADVSEDLSELNLVDAMEKTSSSTTVENEDGFEIVEDPRGQKTDEDTYEDKNRKVLRSLEQGDSVVDLWNVCRIIGLESVEGLLIQGRNNLYLIDNFFQRSDGEIVNLWEAPTQERDPYLQTIAGTDKHSVRDDRQHETRHWSLDDLVSVSRRQFLFRNVALEFFFADGRSFLITTISVKERDQIHNKLIGKVSNSDSNSGAAFSDELWRTTLQPSLQGGFAGQLGKIANVFGTGNANLATRRWIKGEISNFYYLMLVNTMAGRTYNDLTQYPVFPWVIADYTSEELDLTNPQSFRDLSKPMGAQTPEREQEFQERYQSLADLNDSLSPPFHYGTHFSSAMIVSSYMIRLEPFVQSYLLLQGGHFDHADRLFYSIERAWQSASRDNMADVRELIPEFFYLPEFLTNSNAFKFGSLQNTGEVIDDVQLPRWAKGDPKIFIQKNREALESEYVSQHLHEWIDLVFGYKQRGEAAVEATNVFHHLSYHGAIDLDKIEDPLERIATIGIIHNFGQTPHQVFTRPHAAREVMKEGRFELEKNAEVLHEMVSATGPLFSAFVPPTFERMVEWGFCDDGVRFKLIENGRLIGHVEKLHQGHLTCVKIADPRTLVTAGYDCMICVWRMQGNLKSMEVQFRACLRGHSSPIVSLAISRSFSAIVSVSEDGVVLVWDLNRMRFVRELEHNAVIKSVAISDETGEIVTSDGDFVYLWTLNGQLTFSGRVNI